jgi:hypothetical protein
MPLNVLQMDGAVALIHDARDKRRGIEIVA